MQTQNGNEKQRPSTEAGKTRIYNCASWDDLRLDRSSTCQCAQGSFEKLWQNVVAVSYEWRCTHAKAGRDWRSRMLAAMWGHSTSWPTGWGNELFLIVLMPLTYSDLKNWSYSFEELMSGCVVHWAPVYGSNRATESDMRQHFFLLCRTHATLGGHTRNLNAFVKLCALYPDLPSWVECKLFNFFASCWV